MLRRALAIAGTALILSTSAVYADNLNPVDGDIAKVGNDISYTDAASPGSEACSTRGAAVTGSVQVNYQGNSHFTAGASVTFNVVPTAAATAAGITASGGTADVPNPWATGGDFSRSISITTPSSVANGTYTVNVSVTGPGSGPASADGVYSVGPNPITVSVNCSAPTNTAPTVSFLTPPATANEGDTKTFNFSITDTQGGAMTFASGYPDCGAANTVANASITPTAGSFDCTFVDGLDPAVATAVKVKVVDSGGLASNEASTNVTVSNMDPVVAAPSFGTTLVCQGTTVSLTGISFSDAGIDDDLWSLVIDWGDGSTDYSDTAVASQGSYSSQSHSFPVGGPYTATVSVTDKDGGEGSNTSTNSVSVVAHYSLTFLQPVDGTTAENDPQVVNSVKFGRVVPIKILVRDNCANDFAGAWVTDPSALVRIRAALAPSSGGTLLDSVEQYADAGSANSDTLYFRWTSDVYAPGGGFWIYNLDTKNFVQTTFQSGKTYRIDATIGGVLATGNQYALLKMVK